MPTGNQAAVGGKVAAAQTNQYGDFPSAVAIANDASLRSITSSSYAALSTPVSASLVLTRTTLVAITFGCIFGDSAPGTPTNWASLSVALTGAYTEAASDFNCVR